MKAVAITVMLVVGVCGCSKSEDALASSEAGPQAAEVAKTYKQLRAMTKEPVFVDLRMAMLCQGASQGEVDQARKMSGPHAHTTVSIYMNELAADTFLKSGSKYPVGALIVKEKKAMGYRPRGGGAREMTKAHDGVGGMIKRPAGYDPGHGDWEYFYFEDAEKVENGKIESCVQCHQSAAGKDYVFGGWGKASDPR